MCGFLARRLLLGHSGRVTEDARQPVGLLLGAVFLGSERLQLGRGRFEDLVFSPNGNWLLTGWPEADQLLFLGLPGVNRLVAIGDVRREFDPGTVGATAFPRIVEWCCPAP